MHWEYATLKYDNIKTSTRRGPAQSSSIKGRGSSCAIMAESNNSYIR